MLICSIPAFFNSLWLKEYPAVELFSGDLSFSGELAYKNLKTLVSEYPRREAGTQNALSSAYWVKDQLSILGLNIAMEEFEFPKPSFSAHSLFEISLNTMSKPTTGINVSAVSPGKTNEAIIIGAHRDTYRTIEGAEDNGSGTVTMLELARVLIRQPHYYTYIFVSFDAEEMGLYGSLAYAEKHSGQPIKLAYILDMTGYKNADTIGFYQHVTGRGGTPLWVDALARSLLQKRGFSDYRFGNIHPRSTNTVSLFSALLQQRIKGMVNTDSGPFIDRNIPAIGVMAAKDREEISNYGSTERPIHTSDDVIENVSAKTLDMVGKFSEQYIRSVGLNRFGGELSNRYYLLANGKILGQLPVTVFILFVYAAYIMLLYMRFRRNNYILRNTLEFIKKELYILFYTLLLSLFSSGFWFVLRADLFRNMSILLYIILWLVVSVSGTTTILVLRIRNAKRKKGRILETGASQQLFLGILFGVMFIIEAVILNPFTAMAVMAVPMFILSWAGFKTLLQKVFSITAFILWTPVHVIVWYSCLQAFSFDMGSIYVPVVMLMNTMLWMFSFVYMLSSQSRHLSRSV